MSDINNPVRLVKELKGAPLAILLLLSWSSVPVSNQWLEVNSGYSDKPVSKALYYLREHGFIIKTRGGWRLSDGVVQLPLPSGVSDLESGEGSKGEYSGNPPAGSSVILESRNNSDSSININYDIDSNIELNNINNGRNFSGSLGDSPADLPGDSPASFVVRCLSRYGIKLNSRTRALIDFITCDDIVQVFNELSAVGKSDQTGLAVVMLESRAAINKNNVPIGRAPRDASYEWSPANRFMYSKSLANFGIIEFDESALDLESGFDPDSDWDSGFDPDSGGGV